MPKIKPRRVNVVNGYHCQCGTYTGLSYDRARLPAHTETTFECLNCRRVITLQLTPEVKLMAVFKPADLKDKPNARN